MRELMHERPCNYAHYAQACNYAHYAQACNYAHYAQACNYAHYSHYLSTCRRVAWIVCWLVLFGPKHILRRGQSQHPRVQEPVADIMIRIVPEVGGSAYVRDSREPEGL
jgi:hypothetical protein